MHESTGETQPNVVLADPEADRKLHADGYTRVVDPGLTPEQIASLRDTFFELYPGPHDGWHNAINHPDLGYRVAAAKVLSEALGDAMRSTFVGYEPFFYTYLVKWRGENVTRDFLYLHRDWMYNDEDTGRRSFVYFLALEDIGPENGWPSVLPGGNNVDEMARGTRGETDWLGEFDDLVNDHLKPIQLAAGEAVVWDVATVHATSNNRSEEPRVAVGVWLRPAEIPFVHFRCVEGDVAEMHEIEDDFYYTQIPYVTVDHTLSVRPPKAIRPMNRPNYDRADVERLLADLRRERTPSSA